MQLHRKWASAIFLGRLNEKILDFVSQWEIVGFSQSPEIECSGDLCRAKDVDTSLVNTTFFSSMESWQVSAQFLAQGSLGNLY